MENICHTLAGFALARCIPGRRTRLATTALVGGANLPDIDLAWSSFRSALVYDHYHRGWTHSILGFLVLTSLWWLTLLAVDRWLLSGRTADRTSPGSLLLAAALGIGGAARGQWRGPLTANMGVALFVLYAGLCAASHHAAQARIARMATALPGGTSRQVATLPHPGDPLRWEWIIADASSVRHGVIGALPFFDLAGASGAVLARNLDAPAVEALLKTCAGEVVSEFFRFPFATIEEGPDGGRDVVVRDARYTRQGRGFAVYSARLGADGLPIINRDECP